MSTEKKNQHYLPKFYLRHFSYNGNKKEIGIYNYRKKFYFKNAPLRTQGSKAFFYGEDGKIENALSEIERILAKEIHEIVKSRKVPQHNSDGHRILLQFVALTFLRNPIAIGRIRDSVKAVNGKILEMAPKTKAESLIPEVAHEKAIALSLSCVNEIVNIISDLDYKILLNNTNTKFISSDLPVVRYNQFLEYKKWDHGRIGYASRGLQIFIPLSPELVLMFFDNKIYKVGDKKHKILEIKNEKDIDKLNQLQYLNSSETLFFNENTTKFYIEKLIYNSSKYKRANQIFQKSGFMASNNTVDRKDAGRKDNLIIMIDMGCTTKLEIEGVKMLSGVRLNKLSNLVAQVR